MSAEEIYSWWFLWLGIAVAIVIAAAILLITIIVLARRIAATAETALQVVAEIEESTRPVWEINTTNKVAGDLLTGASAIEANAKSIVDALTDNDEHRAA